MFESIIKFIKSLGRKQEGSKDAAKERLQLVLMQDRANVSADFLDLMRKEIIEVIKKYIDIDENELEVQLTKTKNEDGTIGAPVLYANIPILSVKENAKKIAKEESKEAKKDVKKPTNNNERDKEQVKSNKQEEKENVEEVSAEDTEKKENKATTGEEKPVVAEVIKATPKTEQKKTTDADTKATKNGKKAIAAAKKVAINTKIEGKGIKSKSKSKNKKK